MTFTTTTHEPCLYHGKYNGNDILVCGKIEDFLFVSENEAEPCALIVCLDMKVKTEAEEGLVSHYNSLEIVQSRDYIKIHVEGYIDKILECHRWYTPSSTEGYTVEPIHPNAIREFETITGPTDPKDAAPLASSTGF
jgi:hypothetical protein